MQASDGKTYFPVLVTKFAYFLLKVPQHGPTFCSRIMTKKKIFFGHNSETKRVPA